MLHNATTLRLRSVAAKDEGRYTCLAANKVGKAEADVFLQVTGESAADAQAQTGPLSRRLNLDAKVKATGRRRRSV